MNESNRKTYAMPSIVRYYTQLNRLQPAEKTILRLLKHQLPTMTMLDLGVGGGRTTQYFSPKVAKYIGVDYCPEMIAACQKRFGRSQSNSSISFHVADARNLSRFEDNSFDFILFSFNGIDYIPHGDRLTVFKEVCRVGKPGGYFFFSSHNLQGIEREFDWKKHLSFNFLSAYVNLVMFIFLRIFNRSFSYQKLQDLPYAILRDESHNFRLNTYYIRPEEQLKQLTSHFKQIKVYSWKTGLEITDEKVLKTNDDMWLYYLCVVK